MKKKLSMFLALMLVVGLFAGCSSDSKTSGNGKKDVDLRIWSFTDELKKPIKTFEEKMA